MPPYPGQPIPGQHGYTGAYRGPPRTGPPPAPYPSPPPPPLPYPGRRPRRWRRLIGALVIAMLVAAAAATVLMVTARTGRSGTVISDTQAHTAIQGYLDALSDQNIETIARNTLCGIYDAVREKRTDDAVAKLNSDAFRKQYAEAQVTSIDKTVHLSQYQAHILFTMRVVSATGGGSRDDVQGVAQLLATEHQILVCSYVLHTPGTY
jgi:hypothetical protein